MAMRRIIFFMAILGLMAFGAEAQGRAYGLYGLCAVTIPPAFEIVSIGAATEKSGRGYGAYIDLDLAYRGLLARARISLYSDHEALVAVPALKTAKMRVIPGDPSDWRYFAAVEEAAKKTVFDAGPGKKGARTAEPVASAYFRDFLGYLAPVEGATYEKAYITVMNPWFELAGGAAFDRSKGLEENLAGKNQAVRDFYAAMDELARSFSVDATKADFAVADREWAAPGFVRDAQIYTPSKENLRFRDKAGQTGAVLGSIGPGQRLLVLQRGEAETIGGLKGSWVRASILNDIRWPTVAWLWDGYLRKMSDKEIQDQNQYE
jgi:hypothetical protein